MRSLLVANRGEIAARVLRTARALGLRTCLVVHPIDGETPALRLADDWRELAGDTPVAAFLDGAQIVAAAREMGADAIHPGYGFLSENAAFARAVEAAGITWIGPAPETIELMGDKVSARRFVEARGFPVAPSAIEDDDPASFAERARAVGVPLLVKPSAGGGGKGMRIVRDLTTLDAELATARSEGQRYFGDGRLFVERYVERPRHIEVQVLGDGAGGAIHLWERECSLQRRFQKVVEEAPSATLTAEERAAVCEAAAGIARACAYRGAGTVEFIYGSGDFYFLEMNTRLQVEHPVTEATTGVDLVAEQIAIARGEGLRFAQADVRQDGHAIEARVYAEDPARDFAPTTGPVLRLDPPAGARFDAGVVEGGAVHPAFDPMIGKLIVHAADRPAALVAMDAALARLMLLGVGTNVDYLRRLLADPDVAAGRLHTGLIGEKPDLAAAPPLEDAELEIIVRAAATALPEVEELTRRVPPVLAAMGGWRN